MKLLLTLAALLLSLGVFSLAACSPVAAVFEDMEWVLEKYGAKGQLKSVLEDSEITATFDSSEGQVTGSAGCNSYFASYEIITGGIAQGSMTVSAVGQTEMWCEGLMDQEQEYLTILGSVKNLLLKDDQLTISSGTHLLVFQHR